MDRHSGGEVTESSTPGSAGGRKRETLGLDGGFLKPQSQQPVTHFL